MPQIIAHCLSPLSPAPSISVCSMAIVAVDNSAYLDHNHSLPDLAVKGTSKLSFSDSTLCPENLNPCGNFAAAARNVFQIRLLPFPRVSARFGDSRLCLRRAQARYIFAGGVFLLPALRAARAPRTILQSASKRADSDRGGLSVSRRHRDSL